MYVNVYSEVQNIWIGEHEAVHSMLKDQGDIYNICFTQELDYQ